MGKEKKEIGKLLELLNEYQNKYIPDYPIRASEETINSGREILISKRYGFIKWLVENDKIDFHIGSRGEKCLEYPIGSNNYDTVWDYKDIIQWLSISDTPIEDLCSYLKDDATEKVDTLLKGIKKSCESLGI